MALNETSVDRVDSIVINNTVNSEPSTIGAYVDSFYVGGYTGGADIDKILNDLVNCEIEYPVANATNPVDNATNPVVFLGANELFANCKNDECVSDLPNDSGGDISDTDPPASPFVVSTTNNDPQNINDPDALGSLVIEKTHEPLNEPLVIFTDGGKDQHKSLKKKAPPAVKKMYTEVLTDIEKYVNSIKKIKK
jgi:hypothetical protein